MNCRDCRDVADSFVSDELLTETNHEILQHLDTCPSCRAEMAVRRQLRGVLRAAFDRAADLQPPPDFAERLRGQLRVAAADAGRERPSSRGWLMLAASVVFIVGLAGAVFMTHVTAPVDALARDAIADHWSCGLKNRPLGTRVSLEEAAQRFDSAYRLLVKAPPDEISTPNGPVRVVDRHSCAYGPRRFGHVILQYRQHVVSLLVTADDEEPGGVALPPDLDPHLRGQPVNGLSVASIRGAHHAILLVSDLEGPELKQLSTTVSVPLADQLVSRLIPPVPNTIAMFEPNTVIERLLRHGR